MGSSKAQIVLCCRSEEVGHGSHIVSVLNPTDSINIYLIFFPAHLSYIIILIFVTFFLAAAIAERKRNLAPTNLGSLWRQGLGELGNDHELITPRRVSLTATQSFYLSVVATNLFQLVFSFFYFIYNGLLTSMSVASELSRYGLARRALRVSAPIGM